MDKYLKMFKPAMTKWLRDHYPLDEAKKRWKKTVYLDEKGVNGIPVRSCRSQKNMLLLRLEGIDTVEKAHTMIGRYLWADRDEIAKEFENYLADIGVRA